MGAIDQIVNVNISQTTAAVTQASFSIPLIMGPTVPTSGLVSAYFNPTGMLTNGYTTGSPEYVYALEMFEQSITPTQFLVGERTTAVAQVDTFEVATVTTSHDYVFTLNGTLISYTALSSDSYGNILTGLNAALTSASIGFTGVVSGSGGSSLLTITSSVAGIAGIYTAIDPLLTHVALTPNNGIQNDINNVIGLNNTWYGMCLTEGTDNDVLQAAALIESLKKIYVAISDTSAVATTSSTDVGSVLKGKSYKRTALMYTAASLVNQGKEAAWLGLNLPQTPGSNNWAFNNLDGCSPDVLTATQQGILIGVPEAGVAGKNVNIFQTVGGTNITQMGTMAGGQYIDITIGIDWLVSTLQTNVFLALTTSAKIPYTDKGTSILISAVKSAIDQGVVNGLIDGNSPITITAPSVLSVSANQRAQRIAPTISFTCRLQGAFNAVIINGTVTV
jgi:hypothetical protein